MTDRRIRHVAFGTAAVVGAYAGLQWLGRTAGATRAERRATLPGDDLVAHPTFVTDHATTIDAPVEAVWPWLVQMGWGRGGWYTARWVDRMLFPANGPSADRILPEHQHLEVGDFVPDGAPETGAGFDVAELEPARHLVLRSRTHLPPRWADRHGAWIDWTWTFVLSADTDGRTRFQFRSRGVAGPRWLAAGYWLTIIPADFVMSRQMLRGVRARAERGPQQVAPGVHRLDLGGRTRTNVYFVRSGSTWTLVDAGWEHDAARIQQAAASVCGPGNAPSGIVLTHVHPDHSGAAAELARAWRCRVRLHPADLPIAQGDIDAMAAYAGPLDRRIVLPALRLLGRRRHQQLAARNTLGELAEPLDPDCDEVPGMAGWRWIPTPGHTPGHVSYLRPDDCVVITGDAVLNISADTLRGLLRPQVGLTGPPWYTTWDADTARQSIRVLADLHPTVIASGHGPPQNGAGLAVDLRSVAAAAH